MNFLGFFSVFLCAVLVAYSQDAAVTTAVPDVAVTTAVPDVAVTTAVPDVAVTTAVPVAAVTNSSIADASTEKPTAGPASETSTTADLPVNDTSAAPTTTSEGTITPPDNSSTTEPVTTSTAESTSTPGPVTTESVSTPSEETSTTAAPQTPDINLRVNNSGMFCMLVNMEVTLTIEYVNATGANVTGNHVLTNEELKLDEGGTTSCNTSDTEEHLTATFQGNNNLFMQFNKVDSKASVTLFKLTFNDLQNIFPDAKAGETIVLKTNGKLFEASSDKSYKCATETKVNLINDDNSTSSSSVTFKDVQVQAFRGTDDVNFSSAEDCVQDDNVSDIVPIAVGCALAALVVIVLIAYLVGRRQKRQRGYESV